MICDSANEFKVGFESPFQRYRNSLLAGSTPPQLIFGELPRMLQESLSEDSGSPGLQAWTRWERFANEFRRENLRKHRAKQLGACSLISNGLVLVVLLSKVVMRTRLWRCAEEQLGCAFPGKGFWRMVTSGAGQSSGCGARRVCPQLKISFNR